MAPNLTHLHTHKHRHRPALVDVVHNQRAQKEDQEYSDEHVVDGPDVTDLKQLTDREKRGQGTSDRASVGQQRINGLFMCLVFSKTRRHATERASKMISYSHILSVDSDCTSQQDILQLLEKDM